MALSKNELQKKREKEKARKNAVSLNTNKNTFNSLKTMPVEKYLISDCFIQGDFVKEGITNIIVVRKLTNFEYLTTIFLVDTYCLGVKDAFWKKLNYSQVESLKKLPNGIEPIPIEPQYAKKLIEESVKYAAQFSLEPHKGYDMCMNIFAGISSEDCHEEFVFGKEGKPFYVTGPRDDFEFQRSVLWKLENACGEGGFHYLIGGEALNGDESDYDNEDDDDDNYKKLDRLED